MQRHRDIAGSPVRSASEVWATVTQLIVDTLSRSPFLSEAEVTSALAAAAPAGMMLTAAGHLQSYPIVLVAGDLHLSVGTVSGDTAFSVEENLNPVPGAAEAREWTLYLPTPEPVGPSVSSLVAGVAHLSTEPASASDPTKKSAASLPGAAFSPLNLAALADRQAKP